MLKFAKPALLIDTREQKPLFQQNHRDRFEHILKATLPAGDYAYHGNARIAFERKSLEDLIGSVGRGRDRFERELAKLAEYDYAAIVIEDTFANVANPYGFSKMNPHSVIGSLQKYQVVYDLDVIFSGSRRNSELFILNKIEALFYGKG